MNIRELVMVYTALICSFACTVAYFMSVMVGVLHPSHTAVMHFNAFGEMYVEAVVIAVVIIIDIIAIALMWRKSNERIRKCNV